MLTPLENLRQSIEYGLPSDQGRDKRYRLYLFSEDNEYDDIPKDLIHTELTNAKFYDFYPGNKGKVVGASQIIAYAYCGGYKLQQLGVKAGNYNNIQGLTVDHINGDVTDNKPENLRYLSPATNRFMHMLSRGFNSDFSTIQYTVKGGIKLYELCKQDVIRLKTDQHYIDGEAVTWELALYWYIWQTQIALADKFNHTCDLEDLDNYCHYIVGMIAEEERIDQLPLFDSFITRNHKRVDLASIVNRRQKQIKLAELREEKRLRKETETPEDILSKLNNSIRRLVTGKTKKGTLVKQLSDCQRQFRINTDKFHNFISSQVTISVFS